MLITRKSTMSGISRTQDLPVTPTQFDTWEEGALIQDAFPQLSEDQREFLMTGITADEWDEAFLEDEL